MRRYDLVDITLCGEQWREMIEDSLGEWVLFDDVEASVMTSDRYLAEIQECRRLYGRAEADRDAWKERAERARNKLIIEAGFHRRWNDSTIAAALSDDPPVQP